MQGPCGGVPVGVRGAPAPELEGEDDGPDRASFRQRRRLAGVGDTDVKAPNHHHNVILTSE